MPASNKRPPDARLRVRVQPRASHNQAEIAEGSNCLLVKVTAPPVKGAANRACIELLADVLGVRKSDLAIIKGHHSRDKVIRVTGLSETQLLEAQLRRRIEKL